MRILLLGATGGTGREIVRRAAKRDIGVIAVVRSPEKLEDLAGSVVVRQGDVFDSAVLADAAQGCDAAVSVIGAPAGFRGRGATTVYSRAAAAVVAALGQAGIDRLLFMTSAGVEADDPGEIPIYKWVAKPLFLQRGYDDMIVAEETVRSSGTSWTLVRPSRLTDGPLTRKYRVSPRLRPPKGTSISRADSADFVLSELLGSNWVRATPTLAY